MSLVVVNVSAGSAVVNLPSISSVPGRILTVKDNGSASATNIATLTPTAGDTFESGAATYLLNTPFAYVTFIGNGATLKWRVLDSTYPDIPINIPPIIPSPGTLGGVTGTLTNLTVSGPTLLGNSSNTGNLGVAGTATISTLSVTGNAAFSKLQVQGGLSVFSSLNAYNINFTSSITSNGLPFSSGASASSGFAQITNLPLVNGYGICFDPSNNMYIGDPTKNVIYKITPTGITSLFAGTYGVSGNLDGIGSAATFSTIASLAYDSWTNGILIAQNLSVRWMSLTGQVITIAGNTAGNGATSTTVSVPGSTSALFRQLIGICSDGSGNIYVVDQGNNGVKKINLSSQIVTLSTINSAAVFLVAGDTTSGGGVSGYVNATGSAARFSAPRGIALKSDKSYLFVSDTSNNVIRAINTSTNVVITVSGNGSGSTGTISAGGLADTDSTTPGSVQFYYPAGMCIDQSNNLLITTGALPGSSTYNSLRFVDMNYSGTPISDYTLTLAGGNSSGTASGVGANARMNYPANVTLDVNQSPWIVTYNTPAIFNYNLKTGYLSIYYQSTTSLLTPGNIQNTAVSTIVVPGMATETILGSGFTTFNTVTYKYPSGIVMDSQNNLYVADSYKIRKVTPSGVVTSIYGDPSNLQFTMQQGTGATGQLNNIFQMSLDTSGNMYIVGISQNVIYKLNLTTYAGTAISITGQVLSTTVAVLYLNNKLYITNRGAGSYVVMVDLSTNVSTLIAGSTTVSGGVNNATGTSATFNTITGSCFDSTRTSMIVCDTSNNILRTINLTSPYAVATLSFGGGLAAPVYVAIDSQYNLYVSNYATPRGLIKIPYTGSYTSPNQTYGTAIAFPTTGGINYVEPQGITIDSYNNIYITDSTNRTIYSITPSGITSVYSGQMGVQGTQDSRYASSLTVLAPYVGIGKTNPQYPLDIGVVTNFNSTVNFSTNAQITTTSGFAQIAPDQLPIDNSRGFCFDPSGNIYVNASDRGMIYKINPQGVFSLFAGNYQYGLDINVDGIGTNAMFTLISNMCYDSYTGCIVLGGYGTVRLLNPVTAQVTTIAGNYSASGTIIPGNAVGTGKAAQFQWAYGVCTDNAGNFYVADNTYNNIKKVSISSPTPAANSGVVTMVAGSTSTTAADTRGYTNATGTSARFYDPEGITINSTKTALYVVEYTNNVIRQITLPGGVVTTVAGAGTGSTGALSAGAAATTNSLTATSVQFNNPIGIAIDANNNLLVGEYTGGTLRYVNLSPFYTLTLAGNGTGGGVSGVGTNSSVGGVMQISFDPYGNPWTLAFASFISQYNFKTGYLTAVYAPSRGSTKIAPYAVKNSAISTIAAPAIATGTLYGSGYTITNSNSTNPGGATYTNPNGIVVDSQNNVYVGDQYKIRKISPSGVVTSIYGDPSNTQNALFNGTGANSQTANVYGMCFDNSGNMYFTTTMNSSNYVVTNISRLNLTTYAVTPLILTGQTSISNGRAIIFDGSNTLYIACQNLTKSGYIVTVNVTTGACVIIAGSVNGAQAEADNATGTSATFSNLLGICLDPAKQNLYSCSNTGTLRKISLTAPYPVTTPALTGFASGGPKFIVCDSFGNLFFTLNTRVVKVVISTLVATAVNSITYSSLEGIAIDSYNNLYVCDGTAKAVYIINSAGNTTANPTNSSVYSGVVSSAGTQDSVFASSITLMAPFVGINTANPTSALHVNGNVSVSSNVNVNSNVIVSGIVNVTGSIITSGLSFSNGNSGATYNFTTFNSGVGYTRMTLTASTNGFGNYYLGINCNAPTEFLDVNGNAKVAGNITTTGNVVITGSLGTSTGGFYGKLSTEVWINSTDNKPRLSYTNNSHSHYRTANSHLFRNINDTVIFTIDDNGSINASGNAVVTGTLVSTGGFYGRFGVNQWITSVDTVPRLYFSNNGDTFFYTAANSTFYFQSPVGNVANINGNSGIYTVMSDQRIKKNILITRDSLDIINQINIVSYDYIDSGRGSVKHGIVAQQLQQVYPDAVDTLRNVIPSHLTVVDFDLDSENIIIKCSTPHELVVNDTVKLDIDNKRLDKVILEVLSDTTFVVSSWDNFSVTSSVSLYGKYVNDFLSYDKSQIGILAAGACQTLSAQVSTLQAESSQASTITGIQLSTLQADSFYQQSTIAGLQATITSILEKYPV